MRMSVNYAYDYTGLCVRVFRLAVVLKGELCLVLRSLNINTAISPSHRGLIEDVGYTRGQGTVTSKSVVPL